MTTYERVRLSDGQRLRLRVVADGPVFLVGVEVKPDGDEVTGRGFDERQQVIDKALIVERVPLRMNLTYGELEEFARP